MATTKTTSRDLTAEVGFLARALTAPTLREAVGRLAERARVESWSHEEFLVACRNAMSQRGSPTAAKGGSGQRGSRPASRWRTSTSTPPAA